jgi:hypothetical protein
MKMKGAEARNDGEATSVSDEGEAYIQTNQEKK